MAASLKEWWPAGPALPARVSTALRADAVTALVIAMLIWPFPVMRASLPWAVHGPLLFGFVWLVQCLYPAVCLLVWGRTPGMFLMDLGLDGAKRPYGLVAAVLWAAGAALVALPLLTLAGADPQSGLPARFSGLRTVAARSDDPDR